MSSQHHVLVGVLGSAHTTFMLYDAQRGPRHPRERRTYPPGTSIDLPNRIRDALALMAGSPPEPTIVLVQAPPADRPLGPLAPPFVAGVAAPIHMLTPVEALAAALPLLAAAEFEALTPAQRTPHQAEALLVIGPGLSVGYRVWDGSGHQLRTSWHGRTLLPATTYQEEQVLAILGRDRGPVQVADVCAPAGLLQVYAALRDLGAADEPAWLGELLARAADPSEVIAQAAQARPPVPLCVAALETYSALLGTAVVTLGLVIQATGGVYLGGELAAQLPLSTAEGGWFQDAVQQHGRSGELLQHLPILRVTAPDVLAAGAAVVGLHKRV